MHVPIADIIEQMIAMLLTACSCCSACAAYLPELLLLIGPHICSQQNSCKACASLLIHSSIKHLHSQASLYAQHSTGNASIAFSWPDEPRFISNTCCLDSKGVQKASKSAADLSKDAPNILRNSSGHLPEHRGHQAPSSWSRGQSSVLQQVVLSTLSGAAIYLALGIDSLASLLVLCRADGSWARMQSSEVRYTEADGAVETSFQCAKRPASGTACREPVRLSIGCECSTVCLDCRTIGRFRSISRC